MEKIKWHYAYSLLLALLSGYYISTKGEKWLMVLVLLSSVWLVVTMLVVLISTVFFGKKDLRPVWSLVLFLVALGTAVLVSHI